MKSVMKPLRFHWVNILLCFFSIPLTAAAYEERTLMGESWRGAYIRALHNVEEGSIRIDLCGANEALPALCKRLHERDIHLREIPVVNLRVLHAIEQVRARLERDRQAGPLSNLRQNMASIVGSASDGKNLIALRSLSESVQASGIDGLLRDSCSANRAPVPNLTSPAAMDLLSEALDQALNE